MTRVSIIPLIIQRLVPLQVAHYLRTQSSPSLPQWYETHRKTTMVVFWS